MEKKKNGYQVNTKNSHYLTKNLVIATPIDVSKKLLGINKSKKGVSVHVFHLEGEARSGFRKASQVFFEPSDIFGFLKQPNGSYVVYAKSAKPALQKYFQTYRIIGKKYWKYAEFMIGTELLESERGDGLYLIGDYNIAGLEDSFITGIFAGNAINSTASSH